MPNMSHCRFSNTLGDLRECQEHMDDEKLSDAEAEARKRLIGLCVLIAGDFGDEISG